MRHVVKLDRLREAFGYAVALRAPYQERPQLQADLPSKQMSQFCGLRQAVIAEPLHRRDRQLITKALLQAFQHQVTDAIAAVPGRAGDPTDGLAIAAIQGGGRAQFGVVFAAELKAVRAPSLITGFHRNAGLVPTLCTGLFDSALQHKL